MLRIFPFGPVVGPVVELPLGLPPLMVILDDETHLTVKELLSELVRDPVKASFLREKFRGKNEAVSGRYLQTASGLLWLISGFFICVIRTLEFPALCDSCEVDSYAATPAPGSEAGQLG